MEASSALLSLDGRGVHSPLLASSLRCYLPNPKAVRGDFVVYPGRLTQ